MNLERSYQKTSYKSIHGKACMYLCISLCGSACSYSIQVFAYYSVHLPLVCYMQVGLYIEGTKFVNTRGQS